MRRHFRFEDGNVVKQVETLLPNKYLDLKKPEIEVQVDEAVSLDEARLAAAQAGLNYPTAEQIVEVNGAVGGYMNGAAKTQTEPEQTARTEDVQEPDGATATDEP